MSRTQKTIYISGLKCRTECNYVQLKYGPTIRVIELPDSDLFTIEFPQGTRGSQLYDSRITCLEDQVLTPTKITKIVNVDVDLGGLKFKKFTPGVFNINQFIVDDIDDFIIDSDYSKLHILIPTSKITDINGYLNVINNIPWIEIYDTSGLSGLYNYYNINIWNGPVKVDGKNDFRFNTREHYEQYTLRMIDVTESFIDKFSKLLKVESIDLVGLPRRTEVHTNNFITYKISELEKRLMEKNWHPINNEAMQFQTSIDFEISFTNFILWHDFKIKYQNLDFVTNWTTFNTTDKLGKEWLSSIKWGELNTDFSQDYETDGSGNYAYTGSFSCEIQYWVVKDIKHQFIQDIITTIMASQNDKLLVAGNVKIIN